MNQLTSGLGASHIYIGHVSQYIPRPISGCQGAQTISLTIPRPEVLLPPSAWHRGVISPMARWKKTQMEASWGYPQSSSMFVWDFTLFE